MHVVFVCRRNDSSSLGDWTADRAKLPDGVASLMYVSPTKDEAVFYLWRTEYLYQHRVPRIAMHGLDPGRMYVGEELNRLDDSRPIPQEGKAFSGEYLMNNGLDLPDTVSPEYKAEAYHSRVIYLKAK
ncbi:MAG: alpha-galactosidase [Bacteroidaceae bacterium]|nr:alpha-galactosidase [Bacteroidaceae bacterium]